MSSPTQRSLKELRRLGWTCQVVERFCRFSKRRIDLFGFIDIVAISAECGYIMAVQSTTTANQANRIAKILAEPRAKEWIQSSGRLFVHGWAKRGAKGKRKLWALCETEIELKDFAEPT